MTKDKGIGDSREAGQNVVLPEGEPETNVGDFGAMDHHVAKLVVTHYEVVNEPTAAEYRAKGYDVDPNLAGDAVVGNIASDRRGEPGEVVLPSGESYISVPPTTTPQNVFEGSKPVSSEQVATNAKPVTGEPEATPEVTPELEAEPVVTPEPVATDTSAAG